MGKLLLTLAIIFVSLALGYGVRYFTQCNGLLLAEVRLTVLRQRLQSLALFGLLPAAAMLSLWGLPSPTPSLLALPLLGLMAWLWGGVQALLAARFLKLDRSQTGSLYCCGTFTNVGAVGTLVCVLFYGENAIALAALYRLCEELFYYSVAFPVARRFTPVDDKPQLTCGGMHLGPVLGIAVSALLCGILLNLLQISRPLWCGVLSSGIMILATVFLLFAIGLSLRPSQMFHYRRQSMAVCLIKFIGTPLLVICMARLMGYAEMDGGLPLKVTAILSAMPVAMTALVPPSLFRLDLDMANACWMFSTLALIVVLPVLMTLLPLL
ncbi:MAG: hypothetical protein IJD16_10640 [Desulfovibrio sp.]|nr:hypothetical protein [Desulfovibrio sp.]